MRPTRQTGTWLEELIGLGVRRCPPAEPAPKLPREVHVLAVVASGAIRWRRFRDEPEHRWLGPQAYTGPELDNHYEFGRVRLGRDGVVKLTAEGERAVDRLALDLGVGSL
jgi:hypothetical protein